jgi:hypothetical protein
LAIDNQKQNGLRKGRIRATGVVLAIMVVLLVAASATQPIYADTPTWTPTLPPTPDHVDTGAQITVGGTVAGNLIDPTTPDRFALVGAYGDLLTIGLFPAHGQIRAPGLTLYAPDGSVTATTNGDQDRATLLSGVTLSSTGAYILYVQAADKESIGAYTLSIGTGWILRDLDSGTLRLEVPGNGVIPRAADRQRWTIRLAAGMQFTVSAQAVNSALDPVLEVLSPLGDRLTVAHDFGSTHNALTTPISAPADGIYTIYISAFANQTVGAYQVVVNAQPATPTPYLTAQPIDQTLYARVSNGGQYNYSFQGVPGQTVTMEAHSQPAGTFDPVLEIYGPSGRRVAINDDATPGSGDSVLHVTLNDSIGLYTIHVTGYALSAGAFVLVVRSP